MKTPLAQVRGRNFQQVGVSKLATDSNSSVAIQNRIVRSAADSFHLWPTSFILGSSNHQPHGFITQDSYSFQVGVSVFKNPCNAIQSARNCQI